MEEEGNDPYASILQVCKPTIPTIIPCSTSTTITPLFMRFVDHSLDADGTIIPPESIDAYLCLSPENEQNINNNNNDDDDDCIIIDDGEDHNDSLYIQDKDPPTPPCVVSYQISCPPIPPCVVSYQILSPPTSMESSPASPDAATDDDGDDHLTDFDYYSSHTKHDGHWLAQLKSMATQEGLLLDHSISVVTQFRSSKFWVSSLCLSQLKSMATQQALSFNHAVCVVTQFRASIYRSPAPMEITPESRKREHSLKMPKRDFADPSNIVPSKSSSDQRGLASLSKSKGKQVLADPPLKKQKHCNTNLDIIESSMCNIGSGLNELERVSVFVVSDSESERLSRFIGLNRGLTADISSSISLATKSTGNLDKSNGPSSFVDANGNRSNVAGQHNLAASTCKATINVAKSKDVGSSKSCFENPTLKHVYDTVNMGLNEQPGGRNMGGLVGMQLGRFKCVINLSVVCLASGSSMMTKVAFASVMCDEALHEKASRYYMFDSDNKVVRVWKAVLSGVEILNFVAKIRPVVFPSVAIFSFGGCTIARSCTCDCLLPLHTILSLLPVSSDVFSVLNLTPARTALYSLIHIFEKGYEKDPAIVAKEAIQEASKNGSDVVLVGTAVECRLINGILLTKFDTIDDKLDYNASTGDGKK
ncbi:hypothetical protein Vadar_015735 [Vaccinium darrowii]|uniref:Uncharacterized protein n=1 Tax=Vaccinium darrowii TaxID=229202 RepID=A0ACB7YDP3_9ERIC|nr:hypothetical protein Vadar_015735 [Vaccinium darrowii]